MEIMAGVGGWGHSVKCVEERRSPPRLLSFEHLPTPRLFQPPRLFQTRE